MNDGTYDLQNGGDITVKNISGNTMIKSVGGKIELDSCEGMMDVTAHGGEASVKNSKGFLRAETYESKLLVDNLEGQARISASGDNHPTILKDTTFLGDGTKIDTEGDAYISTTNPSLVATLIGVDREKIHPPTADEFSIRHISSLKKDSNGSPVESLSVSGYIGDTPFADHRIHVRSTRGDIFLKKSKEEDAGKN